MDNMYLMQSIYRYAPALKERLGKIKIELSEMPERVKIIEEFENNFLLDNYQEYFSTLLSQASQSGIVLAHNDIQECNILASYECPHKDLYIIDYEYAGWQPRAMDLANYFNETVFDNAYPFGSGVGCFMDNMITDSEMLIMI